MNKLISTISLSKRAGKLVLGYDVVKEAVIYGDVDTVFIAKDLSPKSEKNIRFLCREQNVEVIRLPVVMDEVWTEVGKRAGILAISDNGLAKKLISMVAESKEELHAK